MAFFGSETQHHLNPHPHPEPICLHFVWCDIISFELLYISDISALFMPQITKSLSQQAYETIRHRIVTLILAPGDVIDEGALRDELGFGRTPIREALQRLSLEKLVMIVPRRGMFVTEIGMMDLQRLFEVRLEMEALAARLACQRGTEAHWTKMEMLLDSADHRIETGHESLIDIDEACHRIMYEAADNKFLFDSLTMMYALSLRLWHYSLPGVGHMATAVAEHRIILDAMRQGDETLSYDLMAQHIRHFQEEIQTVMLGTS